MEKEDLEKLEKSQDIQRLLRLAREEYEQEKSDYPPRPFSSLARHTRREERSGRPSRRVSPWWLVAACLLGLIIGRATVTESPASPESGSVRDNIGYVVGGASVIWKAANPNEIAGIEEYEQIRKVSEDPFVEFDTSAGVFVTSEAYSAYGARR